MKYTLLAMTAISGLLLVMPGCARERFMTMASGGWHPDMPSQHEYAEAQNPQTTSVRIAGLRCADGGRFFIDLMVYGRDEQAVERVAECMESVGVSGVIVEDSVIGLSSPHTRIVGWRTAMHKDHPELASFSILGYSAKMQLQDIQGVARWVVTHEFRADPPLEDGQIVSASLRMPEPGAFRYLGLTDDQQRDVFLQQGETELTVSIPD